MEKNIEIEDINGNTIMSFTINANGEIINFKNCEIADIENNTIRIQQF